ncbi:MAG: hypothetical protein Q8P97_02115 [bacterium]|nr:hypothetical protein [bacterium]
MDALILAQTVFYIVFSVAIFTISILLGIVAYYLIGIARHLRKVSERIDDVSEDARQHIESIVNTLEGLPFISYFFKKKNTTKKNKTEHKKKGR